MKTGIEMIAKERYEQITKHNRTVKHDSEENDFHQLKAAAIMLLGGYPSQDEYNSAPFKWDDAVFTKMMSKPKKEKLAIAGALIAAEIDRLNYDENTDILDTEGEDEYYLWTGSYAGDSLIFWRYGDAGYSSRLEEAKKFTYNEAKNIHLSTEGKYTPIPLNSIRESRSIMQRDVEWDKVDQIKQQMNLE